jgi:aminoglycoside 6'-N-acetyltransferase I
MDIRHIRDSDKASWVRLRYLLWPDAEPSHEEEADRFFLGAAKEPEAVLVAEVNGEIVGFLETSIRPYAEGCTTDSVGFVEGWYVEPEVRGRGIGRALMRAAEDWARGKGCIEFGSDCDLDNGVSAAIHKALGFEEVARIRCFRKSL